MFVRVEPLETTSLSRSMIHFPRSQHHFSMLDRSDVGARGIQEWTEDGAHGAHGALATLERNQEIDTATILYQATVALRVVKKKDRH